MMFLMFYIVSCVFGVELMVDFGKLQVFLIGFGVCIVDGGVLFFGVFVVNYVVFENGWLFDVMGKVGDFIGWVFESKGWGVDLVQIIDGVGIIGIEGMFVYKGKFIGQLLGEMFYEGL